MSPKQLLVVAVIALTPASVFAQTPTGVIEGTVTDSTGGVLAHATVHVREADTNQTRTGTTDSAGTFRLPQLPVGTYRLQVTFPAFTDFVQDGTVLTIGQTVHLAIALKLAGVGQTVAVNGQSPPLDIRQTAATTTVDNERIEELPVQSRDYLHFVLLAPGVVSAQPAGAASQAKSPLPDSGFSFAGLRPRSNMLTIDGLDNNDRYSGTSRVELSLETVREFQV
ncbi:MAG TPA: carboxypeptidase-like regulatory domain-containing protein, partial [Galbitalea sp.]